MRHDRTGTVTRGHRKAGLIIGALALVTATACSPSPTPTTVPPTPAAPSSTWTATGPKVFVTADGQQLTLAGSPLRLSGFNLFDAAASDFYSCEPQFRFTDDGLREAFRVYKAKANTNLIRFWAYQPFTKGGTDFSGLDRLIRLATQEGMLLMPVLEDGPGYCTTGEKAQPKMNWEDDTYFTEGYRKPFGNARLSLLDYAKVVAHRYKDEPTIAAWMIMNEAETKRRSADGTSALVDMARTVARAIREVDPHHLISLGTQGNGAPGNSGSDFRDIYSLPEMDYVEVHDWGYYGSDTEAMPGALPSGELPAADSAQCQDKAAKIACSFAIAKALNKPIIVGEVGIKAQNDAGVQRRATLIDAKMQAAKKHGAAGYLIWEANTFGHEGYGIAPNSNDPLFGVLARF